MLEQPEPKPGQVWKTKYVNRRFYKNRHFYKKIKIMKILNRLGDENKEICFYHYNYFSKKFEKNYYNLLTLVELKGYYKYDEKETQFESIKEIIE